MIFTLDMAGEEWMECKQIQRSNVQVFFQPYLISVSATDRMEKSECVEKEGEWIFGDILRRWVGRNITHPPQLQCTEESIIKNASIFYIQPPPPVPLISRRADKLCIILNCAIHANKCAIPSKIRFNMLYMFWLQTFVHENVFFGEFLWIQSKIVHRCSVLKSACIMSYTYIALIEK